MNKRVLFIAAVLGTGAGALAQNTVSSSDSPPPAPPFVVFPKVAAYTVDFAKPEKAKASPGGKAAASLVKIEVTDTGKARREMDFWSDGRTSERWSVDGMFLIQNVGDGSLFATSEKSAQPGEGSRFTASDFRWLSAETFAGRVTYNGRKCNKFVRQIPSAPNGVPSENEPSANPGPVEALIDVQTLLPVALWNGTEKAAFTFKQAPVGPLQLPEKFQDRLQRIKVQTPVSLDDKGPPPPFVVFPKVAAYTIDFAKPEKDRVSPDGSAVASLVKIEVTDTGKARREMDFWSDGRTSERWSVDGVFLIQNVGDGSIFATSEKSAQPGEGSRFTASDFRWLSAETFAGRVTHLGLQCFKYVKQSPSAPTGAPSENEPSANPGTAEALIDAQTLLPVALWRGTEKASFTFKQAPVATLQLPEKFQERLQRIKLLR